MPSPQTPEPFRLPPNMDIKSTARVTLVTTKGDIEIELFAKELPNLCREFLSNCINLKYAEVEFAKVTSGLIQTLQLDAPLKIKHEKNGRIKYHPRGAVGLLRIENTRYSSASGFFISLDPISQYDSDYVFIGNVVGDSIYNVIKIQNSELKSGTESPVYPVGITDSLVTQPYFEDLGERRISPNKTETRKKRPGALKLEYELEGEEKEPSHLNIRSAHELLGGMKPKKIKGERMIDADTPIEEITNSAPADISSAARSGETNVKPSKAYEIKESEKSTAAILSTSSEEEKNKEGCANIVSPTKPKALRNPSIDPYESELDFSEDEVSYEALKSHLFKCSL